MQFIRQYTIAVHDTGGYRWYRIPGILCIGGAVLLACEARAGDSGDWGDIDIKVLRLNPDGTTRELLSIGESALPPDGSMRTCNNPTLIPDGGLIHMIYHRNYERAFIVTSADAGETWSAPRDITAAYREADFDWNVCATGPGHGIQLRSGRLVAPVWLANGAMAPDGKTRMHWPSIAGCIVSDDHGLTWHMGAHIRAEHIKNPNETTIAELTDGQLLFNIRNQNPDQHRVLAISGDGGQTIDRYWTPQELTDPQCFGSMAATPDGRVLFANCNSAGPREHLTVRASADGGAHWTAPGELDPRSGYADIAVSGGHAYVFYERTSMTGGGIDELVLGITDGLD